MVFWISFTCQNLEPRIRILIPAHVSMKLISVIQDETITSVTSVIRILYYASLLAGERYAFFCSRILQKSILIYMSCKIALYVGRRVCYLLVFCSLIYTARGDGAWEEHWIIIVVDRIDQISKHTTKFLIKG